MRFLFVVWYLLVAVFAAGCRPELTHLMRGKPLFVRRAWVTVLGLFWPLWFAVLAVIGLAVVPSALRDVRRRPV